MGSFPETYNARDHYTFLGKLSCLRQGELMVRPEKGVRHCT